MLIHFWSVWGMGTFFRASWVKKYIIGVHGNPTIKECLQLKGHCHSVFPLFLKRWCHQRHHQWRHRFITGVRLLWGLPDSCETVLHKQRALSNCKWNKYTLLNGFKGFIIPLSPCLILTVIFLNYSAGIWFEYAYFQPRNRLVYFYFFRGKF